MRLDHSIIHAAETHWAERLRSRALEPPDRPDDASLLAAFREHADWYRDRIGAAQSLADVPPLAKADIAQIPVLAKDDLKDVRTSGTSGFQVTVRNDKREREFRRALLYRPQLFCELPNQVTQVVFVDGAWCARPGDPPKQFDYGGCHYDTWFAGAAGDPHDILRLLNAVQPDLIRGIASAIVRFIEQAPGPLHRIRPRYVGPGGEYLRHDWRTRIATAFDTQVLDRYGSTETGALAWQCPHCEHYHANADEILIEPDSNGLIATPLFISSQPLLRYRLGDLVEWEPEPTDCLIQLPTLRIREARRDDWVIDGAGNRISPLGFQFEQIPGLAAWRLHQAGDGSLTMYFDSATPGCTAAALSTSLLEAVPGRVVRVVEGVWRFTRPGKFKRVSSDFTKQDRESYSTSAR
ncbi:MAG: hypothetical protein QNJ73_03320 [Gammaproteobacteria bacterium]|nr:hypothetical protein [Gammaproteobacteria bacterium]